MLKTDPVDTSLDQDSPSEYDSDAESIDEGPIGTPGDLQGDLHITNPSQWLRKLSSLESHVIESSRTYTSMPQFDGVMPVGQCLPMLREALSNHSFLMDHGYCADSLNFVTTSAERPEVAYLQRISRTDMQAIEEHLIAGDVEFCTRALEAWHFGRTITTLRTFAALRTIPAHNDSLEALANIFSRLFALAVISFSGAHMERFDQVFLNLEQPTLTIFSTIQLRLRSLKCLDEYLGHHKVWVFEDGMDVSSPADGPLYLSATMSEFDSIWGPVWADLNTQNRPRTLDDLDSNPVLRYRIGTGSIIPCQWTAAHPELREGEVLAHFTWKSSDITSAGPFPPGSSPRRLLIGAKLEVRRRCLLNDEAWLVDMRANGLMSRPDTDRLRRVLDAQVVAVQLSAYGIGITGQEQYKWRQSPLKERILALWINDPSQRDPQLMSRRVAVKISACSGNAKRVRLCRALGSQTMRRYLSSIRYWDGKTPGLEEQYFGALNSRYVRTFERLWTDHPNHRTDLGFAVAHSLAALSKTGTHHEFYSLDAFWTTDSENDPWMMSVPHRYSRWNRLLSDTSVSATFAVVTNECLVMRQVEGFGCRRQRHHESKSLLETSMLINPEALKSKHRNLPVISEMMKAVKNFDLGESGRLQFSGLIPQGGFLMEWKPREILQGVRDEVKENIDRTGRLPTHWESAYDAETDAKAAESHGGIEVVKVHVS